MVFSTLPELMHAHPLLTVGSGIAGALAVFFWALFAGSRDEYVEELQQGSDDWMFPPKQKESA